MSASNAAIQAKYVKLHYLYFLKKILKNIHTLCNRQTLKNYTYYTFVAVEVYVLISRNPRNFLAILACLKQIDKCLRYPFSI